MASQRRDLFACADGSTTRANRRTVCYVRVSTEEQALEGFSLPDQERRGRAAAAKRGDDVAEVYSDHHTGKSRNRPGLKRLLADAQAGTVGTVIITEVDRLARRASHALAIDEELHRFGAGCVFLEQNIDTTTDNGKLMFTIYAGIAEYERTQILKRTRNGQAQKAREGRVHRPAHMTPYGYLYIPQAQRADYERLADLGEEPPHINGWVIVEREAAVVRRIFEGIAGGLSVGALCATLNGEGVPTKRGNPWRHATIWAMLHRSHFWGSATHGHSKRVEIDDDTSTSRKNPNRDQVIEIPVPAIVTEDLAIRAQEQCHRNMSQARRNAKNEYLLGGGLVRCGECAAEGYVREDGLEYAMGGKMSTAKWRHYRCYHGRHRAYQGDRPSSHHAVNADQIEARVWDGLCALLAHPESVLEHQADLSGTHEDDVRALDADLTRLDADLTTLDTKRAALLDLVGSMDKARILQKDAEFANQQDALTARRRTLLAQRERVAGTIQPVASIRLMCAHLSERMRDTTFEQRRVLVQLLITKIVVTKERYLVECVLPAHDEAGDSADDSADAGADNRAIGPTTASCCTSCSTTTAAPACAPMARPCPSSCSTPSSRPRSRRRTACPPSNPAASRRR